MTQDSLLPALPERRRLVAAAASALDAGTDMLIAAGTEALVPTSMLAADLRLPMAYLRPRPKAHGRQQRVEGKLCGSHLTLVMARPEAETARDYVELVDDSGAQVTDVLLLEGDARALAQLAAPVRTVGGLERAAPFPTSTGAPAEPSPAEVARVLLHIGAVIIRSEPFRYASGLLSPIYTDCRLLISHPAEWQTILDGLAATLRNLAFDVIDGVATSGIPHASALAYRLDKPLAYVDAGHIAGAPPSGSRLVVVEDLVTTGKSVLEATDALRTAQLKADHCVAIFTYDRRQPSLEASGIEFRPLSDLATLLNVGLETGAFGVTERDAVLEWRRDPRDWTARHEPG